jgi:hypothetical protein
VGASGGLPLGHEITVGARRRTPVGGVLKALGPFDELLLVRTDPVPRPVEVGEVTAAPLVEGLAGGPVPLPESVVGALVDAADRLPPVQDGGEPVAGVPPPVRALMVAGGEFLGLGDERLLAGDRLLALLRPSRRLVLAGGGGAVDEGGEAALQGGQITDDLGGGQVLEQLPGICGDVTRRRPGAR